MTTAPDRFATWLSTDVAPVLKAHGFTKSRFTFHKRGRDGWGEINFQKSQFGSRFDARFAVNLGVASDVLTSAAGVDPTRKPTAFGSQWGCRLNAAGDGHDQWWTVNGDTDLAALTGEIVPLLLDVAIPLLDERLTTAGLLRSATRAKSVGWIRHEPEAIRLLTAAATSE
jgi:hypothetical protein